MRAFSITAPFETGYQEIPEPELTPGSVLLAVKFVGLCGSVEQGGVPHLDFSSEARRLFFRKK